MATSSLPAESFTSPALTLARLGPRHGYRFDGDIVHLHATFDVLDRRADHRTWALQLWACPSAPAHADALVGNLVAQVVIPSFTEADDEIEVSTPAQCPAGDADHSMVLVLAASRAGRFNEVHDVVAYPARERFVLPRLVGTVGYRIDGYRVHVAVGAIENPRDPGNLSGTLALELWALPAPYAGGAFEGVALAGGAIESIAGGQSREDVALDMPYTPPPVGTWHAVLMLREWTGLGYTTRDFTNFAAPLVVAPPPPVVPAPPPAQPPTPPKIVAKAAAPTPVSTTPTPGAAKLPPPTASTASPQQRSVETTHTLPTVPTKSPAKTGRVSVNTASAAELAAVKGLTKTVASGIVAGRPFKSLDDLTRVKGLGEKTLAKVQSQLSL